LEKDLKKKERDLKKKDDQRVFDEIRKKRLKDYEDYKKI